MSAHGLGKMAAVSWHISRPIPYSRAWSSSETRAVIARRSLLRRESESPLSVDDAFLWALSSEVGDFDPLAVFGRMESPVLVADTPVISCSAHYLLCGLSIMWCCHLCIVCSALVVVALYFIIIGGGGWTLLFECINFCSEANNFGILCQWCILLAGLNQDLYLLSVTSMRQSLVKPLQP